MNSRLLSLLAGAALLGSIGFAQAGEPVALNETQMDQVTAGKADVIIVRGGDVTFTISGVLYRIEGPTETRIPITNGSVSGEGRYRGQRRCG